MARNTKVVSPSAAVIIGSDALHASVKELVIALSQGAKLASSFRANLLAYVEGNIGEQLTKDGELTSRGNAIRADMLAMKAELDGMSEDEAGMFTRAWKILVWGKDKALSHKTNSVDTWQRKLVGKVPVEFATGKPTEKARGKATAEKPEASNAEKPSAAPVIAKEVDPAVELGNNLLALRKKYASKKLIVAAIAAIEDDLQELLLLLKAA